jgi:hypothetical protein
LTDSYLSHRKPTLFTITINSDPYIYFRCLRQTFLWMDIPRTRYTIVAPGEYVFIDRHFNTFCMTQAQMNACIASDFKRWKRPDTKPLPHEEDLDEAD